MKGKIYTFKELEVLKSFFDNPEKGFQIREISRLVNINPITIREYLNNLVKKEYLIIKKEGIYPAYYSKISKKYLNLKLFYNLENIRISGLVEFIEKEFDFPVIVLFGSYSKAQNSVNSDIDIGIISEINKEPNLKVYEKILNKKIQLHLINKKAMNFMKTKNPYLLNNLCNGIVLSGELEIIWTILRFHWKIEKQE